MGEMEVDNFEAMEIEVVDKVEKKEGSSSMVRWENFVPRTSLRVLLVEADDSTRQIIGALLRKCSYKVATAPDGLKAWEVLKARPRNIDLILTEMELPSISGYALLTLIMEHDICKNIPVIMMSKYDAVSTVYKCMTRGAADFLVKPIRINELKNLWQHVWRRQSQVSRVGLGPQSDGVAQEQLEATAENNATSDRSSGSKACVPMREDCLKKGSDAQSSCGKVDLEGDTAYVTDVEVYSQPKQGVSPVSELRVQEHLVCGHSAQNLSTPESAAADTAAYKGNSVLDRQERLERQSCRENVNLCALSGSNKVITNSPREAMDLIGAFDSNSKRHLCTNDGAIRSNSTPHLDLSLMRCSIAVENKMGNENPMLNHSNASAFTRYVNNTVLQASNTTAASDSTPKNNKVQSGDHLLPIPLSMGGDRVDGSSTPRTICTQSPSPSSANKPMNSYHQFNLVDQISRVSSSEPVCRSLEDRARLSANDQCGSSYLCEDGQTARHLSGLESGSEQTRITHDMRALQREAALNKFRLKRKERCFDKKVRYESRKKLAEQRPRVKGQFVRQVPPDPPPPKSNHSGGTIAI